jgi:hypothetical protein
MFVYGNSPEEVVADHSSDDFTTRIVETIIKNMGSDAENGGSRVIKKSIFASCIVLSLWPFHETTRPIAPPSSIKSRWRFSQQFSSLFRLRRARLRRFEPLSVVSVSDKSPGVSERHAFVQVDESLGLVKLGTAGVLPFHLNAFFQTVLRGIAFEFHGQLLIKVDNGFVGEIE